MGNYIQTIKLAIMAFPFIALIISVPAILIQYRRYGALSFTKAIVVYSFILYLMCAYFLVILPLPKIEEVLDLTTQTTQLIPFRFVADFIEKTSFNITDINTYVSTIKEACFFVPMFNILITLPFGIYLRYYFKCDMKKTIVFTALLSLFFELTQLSGLYFIYPRGYRLFDVDDIMLNVVGGIIGYYVAKPVISIMPKRDKIDEEAKERGKSISGFRRTVTTILDLVILLSIELAIIVITRSKNITIFAILAFVYYCILPILMNCSTLGEKFMKIQVVDEESKSNRLRLLFRNLVFVLIYIVAPMIMYSGIVYINISSVLKEIMAVIFISTIVLSYLVTASKYVFTNKRMLYEVISKTKQISTIK